MDKDITKKIEQLKAMGLDDKRIHMLITLGFEDFLDEMQEDLIQANESDLDTLAQELSSMKKDHLSPDEATNILRDILKKVYGLSSESVWNKFLLGYLDQCIEEGKSIEDFLTRLKNDDPAALKQVIAAQQDPNFQDTLTAIEEVSKLDE